MKLEISIIVIVHNGQRTIKACLDSLLQLDYPKDKLEIMVVDNNSTDNTKQIASQYPVRYIFEPMRSRPVARNTGIKHAQGDFIAFIDSDCVAQRDWIEKLIKGFDENSSIMGIGGRVLSYISENNISQDRYAEEHCSSDRLLSMPEFASPQINGGNSIFKRETFEKIGFYDTAFLREQDTDLTQRAILCGLPLKFDSKAIVYHNHTRSLKDNLKRYFWRGYFHFLLAVKNSSLYLNPMNSKKVRLYNSIFCYSLILKDLSTSLFRYRTSPWHILNIFFFAIGYLFCCLRIFLQDNKACYNKFVPANLGENLFFSVNGHLFKRNEDVSWWEGDSMVTIFTLKNHSFFRLEGVAGDIWRLLVQGNNYADTLNFITDNYEVEMDQAKEDLDRFLNELVKENILKGGRPYYE